MHAKSNTPSAPVKGTGQPDTFDNLFGGEPPVQETAFQIAAAPRFNKASENSQHTLATLAEMIRALPAVADKKDGIIIYPGRFEDGVWKRNLDNIQSCTGAAFDFDGRGGDTVKREDFEEVCREAGVEVITWLTHSAPDDPSGCTFRALFPYLNELPVDLHRPALAAIGKLLGMVPQTILHAAQGFFCQPREDVEHDVRVIPGQPIDTLIDLHGLEPEEMTGEGSAGAAGGFDALTEEQVADAIVVIDAMREQGLHEVTGKGVWHRVIGALALYGDQGEALAMRFSEGGCRTWKKDTLEKLKQKRRKGAMPIANLFAVAADVGIENPGAGHRPSASEDFADDLGAAEAPIKVPPPEDLQPQHLPEPYPGPLSTLVKAMLRSAYIVQPDLAMLAALVGMASTIPGIFRYPDGLRVNLYGAVLADTGEGKEAPLDAAQSFAAKCGAKTCSTPASGEALEDQVPTGAGLLVLIREAGHIFAVMAGKNAAPHHISLEKNLLDLFTASKRIHQKRSRAALRGQKAEHEEIPYPMVNALLASTPVKLGDALSIDNIKDGMLGRILFAFGRQNAALNEDCTEFVTPPELDFNSPMSDPIVEGLIEWAPELKEKRKVLERDAIRLKREAQADGADIEAALLARGFEKAKRIAGVLAVWENPKAPVVTLAMLDWSLRVVKASDDGLQVFVRKYMHADQVRADAATIIETMRRILAGKIKPVKQAEISLANMNHTSKVFVQRASKLAPGAWDEALRHLTQTGEVVLYRVQYLQGVKETNAEAIRFC